MIDDYKLFPERQKEYIHTKDLLNENGTIEPREVAIQFNRFIHDLNDLNKEITRLNNEIYFLKMKAEYKAPQFKMTV